MTSQADPGWTQLSSGLYGRGIWTIVRVCVDERNRGKWALVRGQKHEGQHTSLIDAKRRAAWLDARVTPGKS